MKVEIEIKDELIVDALVAAFEGGSNYWYLLPDLSMVEDKLDGKYMSERITITALEGKAVIPVYDTDEFEADGDLSEDEDESFLGYISKENIERGVRLYMQQYGSINPDEMDAGYADTLLQLIVMGEVVYG